MGAKKISSEDYEKKYINKKVGNMIVIGYGKYENKKHYLLTKCLSCGEESIRRIDKKNSKYCKKCQSRSFKKFDHNDSSFNRHFAAMKQNAKNRNISFDLNKEDVINLTTSNCYYCGAEPSTSGYTKYGRHLDKLSEYVSNGIDRLSSSEGYNIKNCVSCCSVCNIMKNKFSKELFLEKIKLIYLKHIS